MRHLLSVIVKLGCWKCTKQHCEQVVCHDTGGHRSNISDTCASVLLLLYD